jgi:hypothetical protein
VHVEQQGEHDDYEQLGDGDRADEGQGSLQ